MNFYNKPNKFILGTHYLSNEDIVKFGLSNNFIFHTSYDYEGYNLFKNNYKLFNNNNDVIFKIKANNILEFKKQIKRYLKDFQTQKLYSIQLSRFLFPKNNYESKKYFEYLSKLREKGVIKYIFLEIYWEFSDSAFSLIKKFNFDGYIFCFNLIERDVSNKLFKYIIKEKKKIISLRTFAGASLAKNSKTFINIDYLRFILVRFFLLFLLRKFKLSYYEISINFIKYNSLISYSIFNTNSISNLKKNLKIYNSARTIKNIFFYINNFHKFLWSFNGTNSPSSSKFKLSLYNKFDNFIVKNIIEIYQKIYFTILSFFYLIKFDNIFFVNSRFQFINLIELSKKKILKKPIIFFGLNKQEMQESATSESLLEIKKNLNFQCKFIFFEICRYNNNFLYFIFIFLRFFKRFHSITIGNIYVEIFYLSFLMRSNNKFIVDDGTNSLFFNKSYFTSFKLRLLSFCGFDLNKVTIFTIFNKLTNFRLIEENNLTILKNKKIIDKKSILILGNAFHNKNIISFNYYKMCILKIVKKYKKFNIFFYLHPKEFYDKKLKAFFNDNNIKYNHYILPSELNIFLNKKVPFKIFSIYSTSIFSFSKFLHPAIKLYNLDISVSAIRSKEEVTRIKLIKDYIIKNSNIELIKI
jgi:hypothetical protein